MVSDAPAWWARAWGILRLLALLGTRDAILPSSALKFAEVLDQAPVPSSSESNLVALGPQGLICLNTSMLRALPMDQYCFQLKEQADCSTSWAVKDALAAFRCIWSEASQRCDAEERPVCDGSHARVAPLSFKSAWHEIKDRQWLGKHWFANSIQDWQIANGRVECLNNVPMTSGRTAHLLTQRAPTGNSALGVAFTLDFTERATGLPLTKRAFGGILVGMGHKNADYRQTALVQMVPGEGGGLLVGVDGDGQLSIRRFNETWGPNTLWHSCELRGEGYLWQDLKQLAECKLNTVLTPASYPLRIRLSYQPGDLLKVVAADQQGTVLSRCYAPSVTRRELEGKMSLFSAHGPVTSKSGFAFSDLELSGFESVPEHAYGPVLGVLYSQATFGNGHKGLEGSDLHELRMTVQLPVLGPGHKMHLKFQVQGEDGSWTKSVDGAFYGDEEDSSWTSRFHFSSGESMFDQDRKYRLVLDNETVYTGIIRREKSAKETTVVGSLSCNKNAYGRIKWHEEGIWFPFNNVTDGLKAHDPDMLFFAGDQVYNGDLTPADVRTEWHATMDYHYKWQRFLWSFGELTKDRPTVVTPDDHDMYQGNLWGEGGTSNVHEEQASKLGKGLDDLAGFWWSGKFVNAVIGTQASNLPPSRVTKRIGNEGIRTYTTSFRYGGVDFIVLADRLWKAAGHKDDSVDLPLLGEEQEQFLEEWGQSKPADAWTKVALSQSPMASLFTGFFDVPRYREKPNDTMHPHHSSSRDSNGWPAAGRDRAVKLLSKAGALHLTGDQHLGLVVQYGTDNWGDGSVVFSSPAVACAYPRYWLPPDRGGNLWEEASEYMGEYQDGFANKFTILAASNPVRDHPERRGLPPLYAEKSPGYGIVRFSPNSGTVMLENWPPWSDPCDHDGMYDDWPLALDARGRPQKMQRHTPEDVYSDERMYACRARQAQWRNQSSWRKVLPPTPEPEWPKEAPSRRVPAPPWVTQSTTTPMEVGVTLISHDRACKVQANNLGNLRTPQECAQFLTLVPECGYTFMFNQDSPEFGCRCCEDSADGMEQRAMQKWSLYEISLGAQPGDVEE